MSQRVIDLGTGYNTNDGQKLRDGGSDINLNFAELYKRAVAWTIGTYDAITCVIVDNKLYVLSDTVTLPFSSTDFANELATGAWVSAGSNYDDSWIQPAIDLKVQFKGQWVNASYNKNDWVISGAWMGVALVDTTEAFPPEPSGNPTWILPAAPVWEDLTLVGDIYQGLEFYGVHFNTVDGFRIWSNGVADESFRLFAYEVSDTGATTFLDFIDAGSNLPLGWNVIGLEQFGVLIPNQKYRLVLETHAATNTVTLSDNWDWTPSIESPLAGDIGQTTAGLHINQVSGNATDQSTFLDTLIVGDDILLTESGDALRYNSYRITSVEAKTGNVYNFEIILTASGDALRDGRTLDVDFTSKGAAVSTNYNRIVDYWPIPDTQPDQLQGFVTQDPDTATSPTPGLDNNAYGLDLFYETYILSDDWFYIGIGEGSTNEGGGADIQIVDNLTTQDATVALSGNMGYVLENKKLNTIWPGQNVLVDKTNPLEPIISSIPNTTAGYLTRAYFTGETELTTEDTFYKTNLGDKGSVTSIDQTVVNGDNVTQFFAVDFLGDATTIDSTLITGDYTGYLQVQADSPDGNQIYNVEIYLTDDQGVPFDSGIVGQPIGGLGFQVLSTGTTGLIKLADSTPTIVTYPFSISESLVIPIGTRIRYHISATNVGTGIGDVTMHLFSGSDWLTYLDTPTVTNTTQVVNNDPLINGDNQAEVNTNIEANKIGKSGTPLVNQVAVFIDGKLAKGDANLTWDDTSITSNGQGLRALTTSALDGYAGLVGSHDTGGAFSMYATNGQTLFRFDESQRFAFSSDTKANILGGSTAGNEALTIDRRTADYLGIFKNDPTVALDVVGSGAFTGGLEVTIDPLTDEGVGNRGYNDSRHASLASNNFTGQQTSDIGFIAGPLGPLYGFDFAGSTGSTGFAWSNESVIFEYKGVTVFRFDDSEGRVILDPVTGEGIGNRDFNDARYQEASIEGEMTGATKADNQVVISETDYGDGTGHVTGTLYFLT